MKIYIAYKYRLVADKETLIKELQTVSDFLSKKGHKPFILGRDVQKWQEHGYSKIKTLVDILRHIGKNNALLVYISSDVYSNGIPVEFALAKLLGLKTVVARHHSIKKSSLELFAHKTVAFSDVENLLESLHNLDIF